MFIKFLQLQLSVNEAKDNIEDIISFLKLSNMVFTEEQLSLFKESQDNIDIAQEVTYSIIEELDTESTDKYESIKAAFKGTMPEADIETCRLNFQRITNALDITGNVLTRQYLDYLTDIQSALDDLSTFANDVLTKLHSESVKDTDLF